MLAIGDVEGRTLEAMAVQLADHFAMPCEVMPNAIDPEFAFHPERGQYHSSEISGGNKKVRWTELLAFARCHQRRLVHPDSDLRFW